jgi:hypothetical protein
LSIVIAWVRERARFSRLDQSHPSAPERVRRCRLLDALDFIELIAVMQLIADGELSLDEARPAAPSEKVTRYRCRSLCQAPSPH